MNFGNTIEEQYAKISAINKILNKFSKVFSLIFTITEIFLIFMVITANNGSNSTILLIILGLFLCVCGFFVGKYILGKMYGWAWVLFCEKYNPKGLMKNMSNAAYYTAVDGYIWGGTSGAKSTSVGFLIGIILFLNVYIWKGTYYMIKYRNLPQIEQTLKKQLEAKYGTTL